MPTLGLGNTIAFSHLDRLGFPKVRVWGTIGWIMAVLVVGMLEWSTKLNIFTMAAVSSLILGVFSFFLPHTPAPAKGQKKPSARRRINRSAVALPVLQKTFLPFEARTAKILSFQLIYLS